MLKIDSNTIIPKQMMVKNIANSAQLYLGDNMESLKSLPDNSVDSVVTDPPYGLSFMGNKWDHDVPSVEFWKEVYRVLKPGGHVLSFGGTRTYHRMVISIEDAGFEIRDQILWIYGQGFPKSHDIGKELLKHQDTTDFEGWGTGLKPANEPICMARKPLFEKTVAENALKYGTGGLNISGSRIPFDMEDENPATNPLYRKKNGYKMPEKGQLGDGVINFKSSKNEINDLGRFPSNVIIDELAKTILGERGSFFYCPKVSNKERDLGCDDIESSVIQGRDMGQDSRDVPYKKRVSERKNIHPTVKPVDLMRYLVKLITPKNGVVLDPFMGSGSTGIGSLMEDFNFIGMEMNEEYFEISIQRIENFEKFNDLISKKEKTKSKKKKETQEPTESSLGIWANRGLKRVA